MERPYIGKSKNELIALAGSGDAAAQAELDYRANKKGGKALVAHEATLTMEQRMTGLERSMARCEATLQEILKRLDEADEIDEDDEE